MQDHERFRIEDVAEDGKPTAPEVVANKFVAQCGVIVRDLIPITIRNWNRPANADEEGTCLFVPNHAKDLLWKRLMVNFKLPKIELDPNAEDPVEDALQHGRAMEAKVREWALKKMAQCFTNWKKRLHLDYVVKKKTPDFKNIQFEKIKPFWAEFVEYKKSEKAKKMSETNKLNAANKKYHHTMGQGGYRAGIPKWEKLENELRAKKITPETDDWVERARNWFYGHGGTLDSEGRCIYNIRHKEDPLPIERMRKAVKAVKDGDFIPDRENDELTLALGNKEHDGRTRGTRGSQPWRTGFPEERKKYPDRSRQRRKDRAEVEADSQKERMRLIEERLKQQQDEINALKEQSTTGPSQQHTAFDATGLSNNRKSSVASTEVPGDDNGDADDAPTMAPVGYPVDDITEMTHCELHVKVVNISMKVAVGYALPIGPTPTYHCRPVPEGYAVVGVDEIMPTFEVLDLHYPAGEGDVTVLGDAKNVTILWPKECIVLRNHTPRPSSPPPHPSPARSSPPRQPSSSPHPALSPHQSPAQPSPREPSPAPQDKNRKRTATVRRGKRSPKRKQEPLRKVPKVPPKRAYDCTEEETAAIVDAETTAFFAKLRRPKEPEFPSTKEEKAKVLKMLKNLHQPEPKLSSDYERSILKSHAAQKASKSSTDASEKSVAQLGEQAKQTCAPLKVISQTNVGSSKYGAEEQYDPEVVAQYGEAAAAQGMSIAQYLSQLEFFPVSEVAYKYQYGKPLVKPEEVNNLPTKMRRLHNWYMHATKAGANWIVLRVTKKHHGKEKDDMISIEFDELFQLFNQDALDKSIISAYCL